MQARTSVLIAAALIGLLIGGTLIRLLGIDWGRPYAYHPDEGLVAGVAMDMVNDRDWNPHQFFYPSLLIDLQAVATGVVRVLLGGTTLERGQSWLFDSEALTSQFDYFLAGRYLVMAMGVATIAVVFAAAYRWRGAAAGLIAAAIIALDPLHVTNSRYATTDVPVTLFTAATLWASIEAQRRGGDRWWILAGVLAGLAMSTKWNGAVVVIVPLTAYLTMASTRAALWDLIRKRTPYLIVAAMMIAVVLTTPAVILDTTTVLDWLGLQAELYARGRPAERSPSVLFNVRALLEGMGPWVAITGVAGCAWMLTDRTRRMWCVPAFVLVYFIVVSIPATHYERNLLPIVPYLAVGAGVILVALADRLAAGRLTPGRRTLLNAGLLAVVVLGLVPGFAGSVTQGRQLTSADTRTVARDWILDNIPRKAIVAREQYTPQLTPLEYRLRNHPFLWQRDWAWYRDVGAQYLITSSMNYTRFVGNPTATGQETFYRELFALPEVFRVDPSPDHPGPTIRIFELPPPSP